MYSIWICIRLLLSLLSIYCKCNNTKNKNALLVLTEKMHECTLSSNNHVFFSVCRHMAFIMELSNQYHTILLPMLSAGSTLYLYFSSICSISDNKSLHLKHILPETCATTASFGVSLSTLTYLWL